MNCSQYCLNVMQYTWYCFVFNDSLHITKFLIIFATISLYVTVYKKCHAFRLSMAVVVFCTFKSVVNKMYWKRGVPTWPHARVSIWQMIDSQQQWGPLHNFTWHGSPDSWQGVECHRRFSWRNRHQPRGSSMQQVLEQQLRDSWSSVPANKNIL